MSEKIEKWDNVKEILKDMEDETFSHTDFNFARIANALRLIMEKLEEIEEVISIE